MTEVPSRVAFGMGDPGDDAMLAALRGKDKRRLSVADLQDRVAVSATAP
jgi:hypothetical protein